MTAAIGISSSALAPRICMFLGSVEKQVANMCMWQLAMLGVSSSIANVMHCIFLLDDSTGRAPPRSSEFASGFSSHVRLSPRQERVRLEALVLTCPLTV